jgi:2-methylcitrate dehydratase PrpD
MRIFDPIKPNQDPAGQLAEMVVNTVYEDIPKEVIELAKKAIFDTIAVIIAGSKWEVSPQIVEQVIEWGGHTAKPDSCLWT